MWRDWRYSTLAYWFLGGTLVAWGCLSEFLALLNLRMALWPALGRTLEVCVGAFVLSLVAAFILLRHLRRSALLASLAVALLGPGLAAYHGYQYGHFVELRAQIRQVASRDRLLTDDELAAVSNSDIVYRSQLVAYALLHNAKYQAQLTLNANREAFTDQPPLLVGNLDLSGIHRSRDTIARLQSIYANSISAARGALDESQQSRTAISLPGPLQGELRDTLGGLQSEVDQLRAQLQARLDFLNRLDQALAYLQGLEVNGDAQVQGSLVFFATLRQKTAFATVLSALPPFPEDFPGGLTADRLRVR